MEDQTEATRTLLKTVMGRSLETANFALNQINEEGDDDTFVAMLVDDSMALARFNDGKVRLAVFAAHDPNVIRTTKYEMGQLAIRWNKSAVRQNPEMGKAMTVKVMSWRDALIAHIAQLEELLEYLQPEPAGE